jgi:hypothetical protein
LVSLFVVLVSPSLSVVASWLCVERVVLGCLSAVVFLLVLAIVAPVAGALFVLSAVAVVEAQVSSVVLQIVVWLPIVQSL